MKHDSAAVEVVHPELTGLNKTGAEEFSLPEQIWEAAQAFCSPDLLNRITGVERLITGEAIRQYPLVAYLLSTRITEPDLELRTRIVKSLGSLVDSSAQTLPPREEVQLTFFDRLSAMQSREILAILEAAVYDKSAEQCMLDLIGGCSAAGSYLSQILTDRQIPLEIRCQAANVVGQMGFLEALPAVERLIQRLENRHSEEEENLLRLMRKDVELLNAL